MAHHPGHPGLGAKMFSPGLHKTEKILCKAPEHPKVKITSFSLKGLTGFEYFSTMALRASMQPTSCEYPLKFYDWTTSIKASLITSGISNPLARDGSPTPS